jgi:hypothetical protein
LKTGFRWDFSSAPHSYKDCLILILFSLLSPILNMHSAYILSPLSPVFHILSTAGHNSFQSLFVTSLSDILDGKNYKNRKPKIFKQAVFVNLFFCSLLFALLTSLIKVFCTGLTLHSQHRQSQIFISLDRLNFTITAVVISAKFVEVLVSHTSISSTLVVDAGTGMP